LPGAELTQVFYDFGLDENANGLYDFLIIPVGINVTESNNYVARGCLYSQDYVIICSHYPSEYPYLNEGEHVFNLTFDGEEIKKSGRDGPYVLGEIRLLDSNHNYLGGLDDYTTSYYNYQDFESLKDVYGYMYSEGKLVIGHELNITAVIVNGGTENMSNINFSFYETYWYFNESGQYVQNVTLLDEGFIDELAVQWPDSERRINLSWIPYEASYYELKLVINCSDDEDPSNDISWIQIDVSPETDASAYIYSKNGIEINQETTIETRIENEGLNEMSNINVSLYEVKEFSNETQWWEEFVLIGTDFIETLDPESPGSSVDIDFLWTPTELGNQRLVLMINCTEDQKLDNDIYDRWLNVIANKDVHAEISYSRDNYVVNQVKDIQVKIINVGVEDIQNISVMLYERDKMPGGEENLTLIGTDFIEGLDTNWPTSFRKINFSWTPTKIGYQGLKLIVNCTDDQNPSNDVYNGHKNVVDRSIINNTGNTNIVGYLIMKIDWEFYNETTHEMMWITHGVVVNDTLTGNQRVIEPGSYLDLREIWQQAGGYVLNDYGYFRVYSALLDENGEVIVTGSGEELQSMYGFTRFDF
jgi:hypothetical protein